MLLILLLNAVYHKPVAGHKSQERISQIGSEWAFKQPDGCRHNPAQPIHSLRTAFKPPLKLAVTAWKVCKANQAAALEPD